MWSNCIWTSNTIHVRIDQKRIYDGRHRHHCGNENWMKETIHQIIARVVDIGVYTIIIIVLLYKHYTLYFSFYWSITQRMMNAKTNLLRPFYSTKNLHMSNNYDFFIWIFIHFTQNFAHSRPWIEKSIDILFVLIIR